MKSGRWLYALLALGLGLWWWSSRGGDEEAKIRARLEQIRLIVVKESAETSLDAADRARRLAEFLAPEFVLRLDAVGQEITDPAALARPFIGLRRSAQRIEVGFSEIEIEVEEGGRSAFSSMRVTLDASRPQSRRGSYRVEIRWSRQGDWSIEDLHAAEVPRSGLFGSG